MSSTRPSGLQVIKVLIKHFGFKKVGVKGSHVRLKKIIEGVPPFITVVPNHKELAPGTLSAICRQTNIKKSELRKYL